MSSLRIESLRLVWLETFLAVAEAENISQAARDMHVDQSTVSRHMQALEKWLDKKLIETAKVYDQEHFYLVNVGLTDDGLKLHRRAKCIVAMLKSLRSEKASFKELLEAMENMLGRMLVDLNRKPPSETAIAYRSGVEDWVENIDMLRKKLDLLEGDARVRFAKTLEDYYFNLRKLFSEYEYDLCKERRGKRRKKSPGKLPANLVIPPSR